MIATCWLIASDMTNWNRDQTRVGKTSMKESNLFWRLILKIAYPQQQRQLTSQIKSLPFFVTAAFWVRPAATCVTWTSLLGRGSATGVMMPLPQQNTVLRGTSLVGIDSVAEKTERLQVKWWSSVIFNHGMINDRFSSRNLCLQVKYNKSFKTNLLFFFSSSFCQT